MAADTGPIGGNLSHEFVIIANTGESKVYTDRRIFDVNNDEVALDKKSLMDLRLSLIHICRCRRLLTCRSRWSPYH